MRKRSISLTVLLLANNILGMDDISQLNGIGWVLTCGCVESVSVTPTNMIVKTTSREDIARQWEIEPNAEIIAGLDKETVFGKRRGSVTLSPVSFTDKRMGFRIKDKTYNSFGPEDIIQVAYIVLGDTPAEMGEGDVEMVMDQEEWVTVEMARIHVEIEKLTYPALMLFKRAEEIMRDPERMAEVLEEPRFTKSWNELIEKGFIKTNTVEKKGGATVGGAKPPPASREQKLGDGNEQSGIEEEGQTKPNCVWLYAVILLGLLAGLYFIRRKSKN
ncbi:MAG: hypothetical protein FWH21_02725 [Kiritimatiellaeota bacterium]|nr:hypothetical protein [Kiritimatiellota bacterium]